MKITRHPMSSFDFRISKGRVYFTLPRIRGGFVLWLKAEGK